MLNNRIILVILSCFVVAGCVTTNEFLPKDYKGATATLADSSDNFVSATIFLPAKADFFYAAKINNKRVTNAVGATRSAHLGAGFFFTPVSQQRRVPAKQITVDIVGTTYHGAPIGRILGESYLVQGTVKFRPIPGKRYVVRGKLRKGKSSVWIQTTGGRVVGRKILASKS